MAKSANQRLVDALVRHQAFLVGHAKDLAARLGKKLDETTPEMRKHLMETFASNDNNPTAKKLRAAEARLHGLRMPQWNAVRELLIDAIASLVSYEPEFLGSVVRHIRTAVSGAWNSPTAETMRRAVAGVFTAGRTIAEHVANAARQDLGRISGATRIGYLARETAAQIAARVIGNSRLVSPILRAATRALDTIVTTAVHAASAAALDIAARQNAQHFTKWDLWVSVLDDVTTQGCRKLHLTLLERDKGIRPGYHYYCRSNRVPLFDEDDMPGNLESFLVWLSSQGAAFLRFMRGKKVFVKTDVPSLSLDDVKRWDEDTLE